jgi:FkbM family methyltransferase
MRSLKEAIPLPIRDYIANYVLRPRLRRTIRHDYLGEEIELLIVDDFTEAWYGRDWEPGERQEFLFLSGLGIPESGLVFNIGAHQGLVALLLKRKLVPKGRVVAMEMDRLNAKACNENLCLNGEAGITVLNAAISDHCGLVRTTGRSNAQIVTRRSLFNVLYESVSSLTIDGMISKYGTPDLIYLDVEGAEVLAMIGASEGINRVPSWFVELHGNESCAQFGGSNLVVAKQFADVEFTIHISREDKPFVRLDDMTHLPSTRCFLIASREPEGKLSRAG